LYPSWAATVFWNGLFKSRNRRFAMLWHLKQVGLPHHSIVPPNSEVMLYGRGERETEHCASLLIAPLIRLYCLNTAVCDTKSAT
jgi:hypothetical protein